MKINPLLAVGFAVVCVSFSSIFVRFATAPALVIAAYRMLFSFLILLPFTLILKRKELFKVRKKDLKLALLSGLFLALHFITWIKSLDYTSVASSTVLVTTEPVFVAFGSYFLFKEKLSKRAALGGILAFIGSITIGLGDFKVGGIALIGDILALAGAVFVSGYMLCGRELRQRLDLLTYTFLVYGSSTLILFLFCFVFKTSLYPYPTGDYLAFLGLALVCTIFGHTIFNWALRYVQATIVSMSILFEPVGSTILAAFLLREYPTFPQVIGGLIIIVGLSVFTVFQAKEEKQVDIPIKVESDEKKQGITMWK
ncbi:MAG TPA: DMT family transporter [Clostridia bacterium]|nr:DMT family transporter [Clostridia bacterium]